MGSYHKYLVFQALVLILLHIPALIEITAVCPGEVGGVIDYHRTLTFEELVYFQVGLCINRVAEQLRQERPGQGFSINKPFIAIPPLHRTT